MTTIILKQYWSLNDLLLTKIIEISEYANLMTVCSKDECMQIQMNRWWHYAYPVDDYKSNSKTDTYQTRISSIAACGTCCCCCGCWCCCGCCCCWPPTGEAEVRTRPSPCECTRWAAWECEWVWWPFEELGALLTPLLLLPPDGVWSRSMLPTPPPTPTATPIAELLLLLFVVVEEAVRSGGRGPRMWCDCMPVRTAPFDWCLLDCCCCWYCCSSAAWRKNKENTGQMVYQ